MHTFSSIAGGFADENVTDAVSLKSDNAFQSQELVARMKDTDST